MIRPKTKGSHLWDEKLHAAGVANAEYLKALKRELNTLLGAEDDKTIALRPLFLPSRLGEEICRASEAILKICERALDLHESLYPGRLFADSGLHPDAAAFFGRSVKGREHIAGLARLDLVLSQGRPYVVEANVGTAVGGSLTIHEAGRFFAHSAIGREVSRAVSYSSGDPMIAIALWLQDLARKAGLNHPPRVALLEWNFMQEDNERFAAVLRSFGIPAAFINPDEVELKNGQLFHRGLAIDIGIKHYHILDLDFPDDTPFLEPLIRAGRESRTILLGHEDASLMSDKRLLGFLHTHQHLFSDPERDLINRYVPWSAAIQAPEQKVQYKGETVSLETLLEPGVRDRFLLKEGISLQGQGIRIGRETSSEDWTAAVRRAFETRSLLVQEFHPSDLIELPFWDGQETFEEACPFVLGQFVVDGRAEPGSLLRYTKADRTQVINKERGAQVSCVFYEEEA